MKKVLVVNGPNLNLLGKREPKVYGNTTLKELEKICTHESKKLDFKVSFFQSNSEGEMIDCIQIIASHEGIYPAPEGAATLAALKHLLNSKIINPDEKIILMNTGNAYKYLDMWAP